jgi:sulfate adenylyltransferase subunit 1 (EFTu-like GTPase family)
VPLGAPGGPARLPVQTVLRGERRLYAGQVAAGALRVGDEVVVLPGGGRTRVAGIEGPGGPLEEAPAPLSVAVALEDELDVSRGDLLAAADGAPEPARELTATLCWLGDAPARPGGRYLLKHATRTVRARLDAVEHRLDVTTLGRGPAETLELNDLARVRIRLGEPVAADPYAACRATGAFILIDEGTNDTVAAGMVQ